MIKSKSLSDTGWKSVVSKNKVKDNGLLKTLEKLKKLDDVQHDDATKLLTEARKLAEQLQKDKAVAAVKAVATYLGDLVDEVGSALRQVAKDKAAHDKAQAAKAKAEKDDDDEESPDLLSTKMVPLLRKATQGKTMQALVAKSGKQVVVMLSPKPIPPARRKMLAEQLGGGTIKYYPGTCGLEAGAMTFALNAEVTGLAKLIKIALLQQTGLRINKVQCRGDDGDDHDGD